MFTGLIEEKAKVDQLSVAGDNARLSILASLVHTDAQTGDSICVNGCCLTIVAIDGHVLHFDAIPETLERTGLGSLKHGDPVNLERALKPETRIGGHYVTGHIDGPGILTDISEHEDWRKMFITVAPALAAQMASRGSVAVDGVSLTLVDVLDDAFSVALIPHTLAVTTIGDRQIGDRVNIETDLLAKYVERQLQFLK